MPLVYECDDCGAQRASRRCPDGWRMRWLQQDSQMRFTCNGCTGAQPAQKRRNEPAPPARDDGALFGDADRRR